MLPLVLVTLLLSLSLPTTSQVDDDSSYLKVLVPDTLSQYFQRLYPNTNSPSGFLKHSQALFGTPRYKRDQKIVGNVFYVTPQDGQTGCNLNSENLPPNMKDSTAPKIFLVDRGDCDFVDKVRLAQSQGASAVIIADNVCQCEAIKSWPSDYPAGRTSAEKAKCQALAKAAQVAGRFNSGQDCEPGIPFMADDGTGSDVRIPSFMISFLDAQVLKDCLNPSMGISGLTCSSSTVVASLEWDIPHTNKVDWQLWSSSDSDGTVKKAFSAISSRLEGKANFRPRYFLWDGEGWGCNVDGICGSQCTDGGYYCNPDPDHNLLRGVSGRDVVEENLRELCVWDQASKSNKPEIWWSYVASFAAMCHPGALPDDKLYTVGCSEKVHNMVPGLSFETTKMCVASSWNQATKRNVLLDKEISDRKNLKILQLPTVVVNGQLLRGGVTPASILSDVCAGFTAETAPQVCTCVDPLNTPATTESCLNSNCPSGEMFCQRDSKCYKSGTTYDQACLASSISLTNCQPGFVYCASLLQCTLASEACPACNEPTKPHWCVPMKQCVSSGLNCVAPPTPVDPNSAQGGSSPEQVLAITVFVVGIAASLGYCFWRRQKAALHDDVRSILESYRALDGTGPDDSAPSSMGGGVGRRDGGDSDAATFI